MTRMVSSIPTERPASAWRPLAETKISNFLCWSQIFGLIEHAALGHPTCKILIVGVKRGWAGGAKPTKCMRL